MVLWKYIYIYTDGKQSLFHNYFLLALVETKYCIIVIFHMYSNLIIRFSGHIVILTEGNMTFYPCWTQLIEICSLAAPLPDTNLKFYVQERASQKRRAGTRIKCRSASQLQHIFYCYEVTCHDATKASRL